MGTEDGVEGEDRGRLRDRRKRREEWEEIRDGKEQTV